jgi:protein-export membrane protein SecD
MNSGWRWKFWTAVVFTFGALWCVVPNFVPADSGAWYAKFLPNSRVQYGLDLQGGVQLTVGVDLNRALLNEAERHVRELEDMLPKEDIQASKIQKEFSQTDIHVTLLDASQSDKFVNFIQTKFGILEIVSSDKGKGEFTLNLPQDRQTEMETMTIAQALETLRNRLDEFGVAEPSIQAKGKDKIVIQLPGLADPERAREILAQTAQLDFKMVDDASMSSLELQKLVEVASKELGENAKPDQFNHHLRDKIPAGREVLFESRLDPTTNETSRTPYLLITGERISGDLLDDARVSSGEFGQPTVSVQFNPEGTRQFDEMTKRNIGKRLAIVLDDEVKSAPVLQSHIPDGRAQITLGSFRSHQEIFKEASDLSIVLRAGALPAPIEILENRTVGPSLGKDSIEKGLNAMMIGILIVILFMIVYYRMSGVIADAAVLVNVIFTIACLGLLGGTLTLPGLAGILVSVGMGVDANIIIFERIREELRLGKTVKAAIETGYDRAHLAILDSNLTTVIVGIILFEFGTGPIKGFALTLIFGLIANYFTAIWFTRLFYEWIIQKFQPKTLSI